MRACGYRNPVLALMAVVGLVGCVTTQQGDLTDNKPDLARAARINTQLGVNYLREGHNEQAEAKLQRAITQDPTYAGAYATLAYLYSREGQPDEARTQYRKALRLQQNDVRIRNSYAVFLCGEGDYDEAMAQFRKAIGSGRNGAAAIALSNAGVCERRRGELDSATDYFRRALDANSKYSPALLQMADLSYRAHNYLQARAFIQRYHSVAPDSAASLALAYRIEKALNDDAAAAVYRNELLQRYPDSDKTVELSRSVTP